MGFESQFLVLGSGIAGLTFALRVADHGSVIVVTKKAPTETSELVRYPLVFGRRKETSAYDLEEQGGGTM